MGIFKYGEITPSGHPYLGRPAAPDDSIYKNGFVIGGRYPGRQVKKDLEETPHGTEDKKGE